MPTPSIRCFSLLFVIPAKAGSRNILEVRIWYVSCVLKLFFLFFSVKISWNPLARKWQRDDGLSQTSSLQKVVLNLPDEKGINKLTKSHGYEGKRMGKKKEGSFTLQSYRVFMSMLFSWFHVKLIDNKNFFRKGNCKYESQISIIQHFYHRSSSSIVSSKIFVVRSEESSLQNALVYRFL